MNTQHETLVMANELNQTPDVQVMAWRAATELRRLHEVNQMLVGALKEMRKKYGEYACEVCDKVDDALAKAKEQA